MANGSDGINIAAGCLTIIAICCQLLFFVLATVYMIMHW